MTDRPSPLPPSAGQAVVSSDNQVYVQVQDQVFWGGGAEEGVWPAVLCGGCGGRLSTFNRVGGRAGVHVQVHVQVQDQVQVLWGGGAEEGVWPAVPCGGCGGELSALSSRPGGWG